MTKYSHEENAVASATTFKMQMQQVTKKVAKELFQDICCDTPIPEVPLTTRQPTETCEY